jgi:hypothetical protein
VNVASLWAEVGKLSFSEVWHELRNDERRGATGVQVLVLPHIGQYHQVSISNIEHFVAASKGQFQHSFWVLYVPRWQLFKHASSFFP